MVEDVERRHEEVPGRHPLASCRWARSSPLWVAESGGGPRAAGQRTEAAAGQEPTADHPGGAGRTVVDRLGFKRSSVLADLASAAVMAAVPLLHLAGVREFWQLVVLVFVLSSLNALGQVVGPILGGILIAASAPPTCCLSTPPRSWPRASSSPSGCPRPPVAPSQLQPRRPQLSCRASRGVAVHPGPHRAAVDDPDRHRGQLPGQAAGHGDPARLCQDLLRQPASLAWPSAPSAPAP